MASSPPSTFSQPNTSSSSDEKALIAPIQYFVQRWMSSTTFDASHDWSHIQRVLSLSLHLLSVENKRTTHTYNRTKIILAALLHDIADRKYVTNLPRHLLPSELRFDSPLAITSLAKDILTIHGAPFDLATAVQEIINALSFSTEISRPEYTQFILARHPEVAIIQDADRLDALGAIGIARAFTYGGAMQGRLLCLKVPSQNDDVRGLEGTIEHFGEKLEKLEGMMKTEEGRRMARERTERLRGFRRWWEEEIGMARVEDEETEGIRGVCKW